MKFKTMIHTGLIAGLTIGLIGCGTYSHDNPRHHHHHHGHHHSKAENQENVAVADQGEQEENITRESTFTPNEEVAQAEEIEEVKEVKEKEAAKLVSQTYKFDFDSAQLTRESKADLEKYIEYLASHPNTRIRIEGHADERGTNVYNLGLSKKRASAVANYLLDRGVAKDQMEVMSFGAQKPLDSGNSEQAYAKNRRAEVQFEMDQDSRA